MEANTVYVILQEFLKVDRSSTADIFLYIFQFDWQSFPLTFHLILLVCVAKKRPVWIKI
jgi:hypothetical protein